MSYRFADSLRAGAYAPARKLCIKHSVCHSNQAAYSLQGEPPNG